LYWVVSWEAVFGFGAAVEEESAGYGRLEVAVGEVEPVEVVGVVGVGRWEYEAVVAVDPDYIFAACGTFGEGDWAVGYDWCGTHGM